ncbi:hypothetical protein V6B05_10435 [Lactococcus garvieae]|uniref:hypothetical protein n=1 Tax=Lactococcus garvieae TaxID=1363 RepID=UPI001F608F15|nr:hypothetical protein [Lactococcus garvieae]MCI3861488.1 hypothetical protein [Lactococcus garvieae]
MNKKLLLTSFLALGVIGAGTVTYGSLTSAHKVAGETAQTQQEVSSPELSSSVTNSEVDKKIQEPTDTEMSSSEELETPNISKETSETTVASQTKENPVVDQEEKEQAEFAEEAVKQDFYLEQPDATGTLSYVKATDETVKELMDETNSDKVGIYQVVYNGELISVLSKLD